MPLINKPTASALRTHRFVEQVMGMPISLALRGRHADTAIGRAAWDAVIMELREVDRTFSTFRSDSIISRLDRGDVTLTDCPPEIHQVLDLAEQAGRQSDGAFSVRLPVDPDDPGGPWRLDPSGVVKGWAADRAARHLDALPDTGFCLSAGGDIVCRAASTQPAWRIGIEDPHDTGRLIATVELYRGAIATSGTAHRGRHLVDARTGRPPTGVSSVTVIGPALTWADIDATAAYAHGRHAGSWLKNRPIHGALVVAPDGTVERIVTATEPLPAEAVRWMPG